MTISERQKDEAQERRSFEPLRVRHFRPPSIRGGVTSPPDRVYRRLLMNTVASSATPYGYTLTIWTTGIATTRAEGGGPSAVEALLMAVGAVLGFAAVGGLASGGLNGKLEARQGGHVRLWGAVHLLPLAANLAICSLLLRAVHGRIAWPLTGFTATTVYLLTVTAQYWCASHKREKLRCRTEASPLE